MKSSVVLPAVRCMNPNCLMKLGYAQHINTRLESEIDFPILRQYANIHEKLVPTAKEMNGGGGMESENANKNTKFSHTFTYNMECIGVKHFWPANCSPPPTKEAFSSLSG